MAFVNTSHNEFILYGKDAINDLFSYTRGILLFIITSIAFVNLVINVLIKKKYICFNRYHAAVGVLFVLITSSYLFSEDKTVAWRGAVDHFEGYYVWIAYLMLFLIAYSLDITEKSCV